MSETRKPFLIGVFLLAGLALLAGALLLLGRDGWSRSGSDYALYFTGSLDGLDVGADVTYRGVKVGTVREIRLSYDAELKDVVIPVVIHIEPHSGQPNELDAVVERLVERGLRAQLQTQSLLTGKAVVALDIFPGQPGYSGTGGDAELPVIPTVPSRVDQAANLLRDLIDTLRQVPLEEMVNSANRTLQALERLANSEELGSSLKSLDATLANVQKLTGQLQQQMPAILDNARQGSAELERVLGQIGEASVAARQAMEQVEAMAGDTRQAIGPQSEVRYELLKALDDLAQASKALQRSAEQIERRPQSLIFGK